MAWISYHTIGLYMIANLVLLQFVLTDSAWLYTYFLIKIHCLTHYSCYILSEHSSHIGLTCLWPFSILIQDPCYKSWLHLNQISRFCKACSSCLTFWQYFVLGVGNILNDLAFEMMLSLMVIKILVYILIMIIILWWQVILKVNSCKKNCNESKLQQENWKQQLRTPKELRSVSFMDPFNFSDNTPSEKFTNNLMF